MGVSLLSNIDDFLLHLFISQYFNKLYEFKTLSSRAAGAYKLFTGVSTIFISVFLIFVISSLSPSLSLSHFLFFLFFTLKKGITILKSNYGIQKQFIFNKSRRKIPSIKV